MCCQDNTKKKIAILGGTFNPIHNGHLLMAKTALAYGMDEVWFVPSGVSYLKAGTNVLSKELRLEMTKLAVKDMEKCSVSTIEIDREGNTYSYETMQALSERYPEFEFYFVLGADSVFTMETWKCPDILMKVCKLLTVVRGEMDTQALNAKIEELSQKYGAKIHLMPMDKADISSTDIRKYYASGNVAHKDVPAKVDAFIREHQLYQN